MLQAAPLPAAPNFSAFFLPDSNSNAASHNIKIAKITAAFNGSDKKAILPMNFGTNTYGKKQVSLANDALAAMGSVHQVEVGQKSNTHPALTGKAKAAVQAQAAATPPPATPGSKPKPTLADLTPDKLPPIPQMATFNGGNPYSTKPWKNAANQSALDAMQAAALQGGMPAVNALKFAELNGDTGVPTGNMITAAQHPATKVIGNYAADLNNAINDFLNPPKELRPFNTVSVSSSADAAAKLMSAPMFKTVASAEKQHQLGFWLALGNVSNPQAVIPSTSFNITPAMKFEGKKAYDTVYAPITKKYISSVHGSGAINRAFDQGQKTFHSFDLKETAKQLYKDATPLPVGAKLHKWIDIPAHMLDQLKKAPAGTVFQSGGGMCTSISPTATSGFGQYKMTMTAGVGAKAIHTHASGGHPDEQEITTLPGQRYMITGKSTSEKGTFNLEVVLLPPDPKWVG
jgi:hypothetical protein